MLPHISSRKKGMTLGGGAWLCCPVTKLCLGAAGLSLVFFHGNASPFQPKAAFVEVTQQDGCWQGFPALARFIKYLSSWDFSALSRKGTHSEAELSRSVFVLEKIRWRRWSGDRSESDGVCNSLWYQGQCQLGSVRRSSSMRKSHNLQPKFFLLYSLRFYFN